jgi:YidC/Oxa1 family membrane protein insertase
MFKIFFYQPVLNLLIFLYNTIPGHDLGVVIIVLTLIIKSLLYPLSQKSIKSQKELQEIQPIINELKEKYKNNKEQMSKAMIGLYKENKINPFSSCLPLLIQLPFLIAVFSVFNNGFGGDALSLVYSFISRPEEINMISLGFVDLSKPNYVLAFLAGLSQFFQTRMMTTKKPEIKSPGSNDENITAIMNKQMIYIMPLLTIFIGFSLPGGLTFYWFFTTILTILQQYWVFNKNKLLN